MKTKCIKRPLLIVIFSMLLLGAATLAIGLTGSYANHTHTIFKITSKLFIDGKLVASPCIHAYANQDAKIFITNRNQGIQDFRLDLVAHNIAKNNIAINYRMKYLDDHVEMQANPYVVVVPNQETKVIISSGPTHTYEMLVLAERE